MKRLGSKNTDYQRKGIQTSRDDGKKYASTEKVKKTLQKYLDSEKGKGTRSTY